MDNDQLARTISSIGTLKHKYIGSFLADIIPKNLRPDSFFISNTENRKRPGSHWVMAAKKMEVFIFETQLGMARCFIAT